MKKILYLIFALALAASCVKPGVEFDTSSVTTSAGGTVTGTSENTISVNFTEAPGNASVKLSATAAWTAEVINNRAKDWCKASPESGGKGDFTLNVSVAANDSDEDRSATVRVSCGDVVRNVIITQKQKSAIIVNSGKIEIPHEGGIAEIKVKSNVDYEWELDSGSKSWVSFVQTKAYSERTLVFKVEANSETDRREATVTLRSGSLSEQVKIYQEGEKPTIIISGNDYAISSEGGEIRVEVSSNVNVECSVPSECSWIRERITKSMSTNTFVLSVDSNDSFDDRYAEVSFVNVENKLSERIFVTQSQKDAIVIACERYDIGYHGGTLTIALGHNVGYSYDISVDWISAIATKSLTTDDLHFKVEMNESDSPREGTITFTSKDGKISQEVKVCQAQADQIIISDLEKSVPEEGESFSIEIKSNIDYSYRIEQSGSWLHDITSKASTSRTLTFRADANEGYDPREALIVVTSNDGLFTGKVHVIQMQKGAIVIANNRYDIGNDGGQISIKVSHNVDFTTETDSEWIKAVTTKALVDKILKFDVARNESADSREGTITFKSKDGKTSQTVKVIQSQYDQLVVGEKEKTVSDEGGSVDIEIKANVDYTYRIEQNGNWLHDSATKGLVSKTLRLVADANDSNDYREARVIITSTDGSLSQTVTVGQVQNDAIVIAKDRYDVDNEGDEFTVKVGHNVEFTVTVNDSWIKRQTATKAFSEDYVKFIVDPNTADDAREGTISFKSKDGKISQTVKVCQAAIGKIIVSESEKTISDQGGIFEVEVQANIDYSYKIEQSGNWITDITTKGMTSKTLKFSVAANTDRESRTAVITVTAANGKASNSVTVTQLQKDAIVVAKDRYDIPNGGGNFSVTVGHNVEFTTEISADWITLATTKAYTEESVIFKVAKNESADSREATVTFKSKDGKLSQTVKVVQAQLDQLVIGEKEKIVSATGGQVDIEIKANVEYRYEILNGSWLHAASTKGLVSKTLSLVADANTSYDYREASVVITSTDGKLSEIVTVGQLQKDAIVVAKDRYDISNVGGSFSVKVGHNVEFTTTIDADWIKETTTKGYTEDEIKFTAQANSAGDSREGTITFKSSDGKLTQTVKVVQAQLDQIIIGETEKIVAAEGGKASFEIQANVNYSYQITSGSRWVHDVTTKGMTAKTITFSVDANTGYDYREATILVKSNDGKLSQTVTIGQLQKDAIVPAKDRYDVSCIGGSIEIKVGSNIEYTTEIGVSWIHETTAKVYTEKSLRFTVDAYTGEDSREGTITFKSSDGKLTQTVKVVQAQMGQIIIGDLERTISDAGGSVDIEVSSNIEYTYSIVSGSSWFHESKTKGMTTKTLHFTADANGTYESREAKVKVTGKDGSESQTVTITQSQKDAIVISKDRYDFGSDGGQIAVEIGHNVDFDTTVSDDWIVPSNTKAYTEETLIYTIQKNTGEDSREGTITYKSKDGKITQKVTVTQSQLNKLIVGETTKSVAAEGGTVSFEVKSNTTYSYSITSGSSWLHDAATKGMTSKTLSFTADANTGYDSRTATILVKTSDGKLSETVTVTQFQKDAIIAEHGSYSINNDGGDIKIVVNSNVSYVPTVIEGSSWISIAQTKAMSSSTINVKVAANTSGTERSGKIKIATTDGALSETVTIIQKAEEIFSILAVTHNVKSNFAVPVISGTGLSGTIDWGDNSSSAYSTGATHSYSKSATYTVTITTTEADSFSMPVKGVSTIDLSEF